ncbi:MAG: hypothetical protein JRM80_09430 [Nitrososphaerota archaeon]|nr:hypothetical protein [Nitrososphaerota archaeon]
MDATSKPTHCCQARPLAAKACEPPRKKSHAFFTGEDQRLGPPLDSGENAYVASVDRNKRSVIFSLKSKGGDG